MKKRLSRVEVMAILRSGNFTIAYHDNGSPCLYKGKHEYDDLPEEEIYEFEENHDGYIPEVVYLLVQCLRGAIETA